MGALGVIELVYKQDDEQSIKFRAMVANILRFIRGEDVPDMMRSIVEFVEASECAQPGAEGRVGPLRFLDINPDSSAKDRSINTVLSGACKMLAGAILTLDMNGKEYQEGLEQLSHGVVMINEKLRAHQRRGNEK